MKQELFITSFTILILSILFYYFNRHNGIYIKSNIDNNYYYVSNLENKQEIADMLAQIKLNIKYLLEYLKQNQNEEYKEYVKNLEDNIDKVDILENIDEYNYTSYSVNKGEELVLCVKNQKTKQLYNINLIMYVVLHEISHIMCPEYGHGKLFQKIFGYVTQEAINCGIYHNIDFNNNPQEYCGLTIHSNILS